HEPGLRRDREPALPEPENGDVVRRRQRLGREARRVRQVALNSLAFGSVARGKPPGFPLPFPRRRLPPPLYDLLRDRQGSLLGVPPRVRLLQLPRGGKVAAQNQAVRETGGEILAFSDANAQWKPDALRKLVRNFADPDVAYVCGGHFYEAADGTNREGTYWRFEAWLRRNESSLGSITGGIGPIYAVRRDDYVEVDPRFGHDLALPYLMV